jgi:hypothetical protein
VSPRCLKKRNELSENGELNRVQSCCVIFLTLLPDSACGIATGQKAHTRGRHAVFNLPNDRPGAFMKKEEWSRRGRK